MRILVGCEESQIVTSAFRKLGHEAYSCDLMATSGCNPEWHIQGDILGLLNQKWDMIIAFPPCTFLTCTANKWMKPEFRHRFPNRPQQRIEAIRFVLQIANAPCDKIAIENPVGVLSSQWRKPDQIVQPYHFGHKEQKKTCLWLKGLPRLEHTEIVDPVMIQGKKGWADPLWHRKTMNLPAKERSVARSKTFAGIADAMAAQWG